MPNSISLSLDGLPCVVRSNRTRGWPRRARWANAYWCPVGPAVGRAWVLMLRADADQVLASGALFHRLVFRTREDAGHISELALPGLVFVRRQRLHPGNLNDPKALCLVELADRRWLAERFSDTGNLQINVRSGAHAEAYLNGTGGHTWATAIAAIWNTMSAILGAFPGLPAAVVPAGAPENIRLLGENAWRALNALLLRIGCTVAYDPVADTFSVVPLSDEQANGFATGACLFDAEPATPNAALLPATIRVYFPTHFRNAGQQRDTEQHNHWAVSSSLYFVDVPTGVTQAAPGTVVSLWDALPRVLDEQNLPANDADLAAQAEFRAARWLADRTASATRLQVRPGIVTEVRPGTQVKAVLWRMGGAHGGSRTELVAHPGLPVRLRGGPSLASGITWSDDVSLNDAMEQARRLEPAVPQLTNLVQVNDGVALPGQLVAPNAAGLLPAHVWRFVAGELVPLEACWIRPAALELCDTPQAATVVKLRQADRYLGRLSGLATHAGDTRPVYVVEGERWAGRLIEGVANSLLWKESDTSLPQWHTSPQLKTGLQLGVAGDGWLQLGDSARVHLLNPASGGGQKIRLPSAAPAGVQAHLVITAAAQSGSCLQTEWSEQGCDFTGYAWFGTSCAALACHQITVRKGLITNIAGLSTDPSPGDFGSVSCPIVVDAPFDPCPPALIDRLLIGGEARVLIGGDGRQAAA